MRGKKQPQSDFPKKLSQLTHLSNSSIAIFQDCPHSWAARYLFGHSQPSNKYAKIGTAVHDICEAVLQGQPVPDDQLAIIPDNEKPNTLQYIPTLPQVPETHLIGVEYEARFKFNPEAPEILAYLDLFYWHPVEQNALKIHDHKTARQYEPLHVWQNKLQPRIYTWLARQLAQVSTVYFKIGYVNHPGQDLEWRTDSSGDAQLVQELNGVWEQMKLYAGGLDAIPSLSNFPQTLNENCGYCPIKSTCASFRDSTILFDSKSLQVQFMPIPERFEKLKLVAKLVEVALEETKVELLKELAGGSIFHKGEEYYIGIQQNRKVLPTDLLHAAFQFDRDGGDGTATEAIRTQLNEVFGVKLEALDKIVKQVKGFGSYVEEITTKVPGNPSVKSRESKHPKDVLGR